MTECNVTHEELSAYIDGELNHKDIEKMITHLKVCEKCQKEIEELESLNSLLSTHYEDFASNLNLDNLLPDLKVKMANIDKNKEMDEVDKVIQFPIKENKSKFYQYAPSIVAIAAMLLLSFAIMKNNFIPTSKASTAKTEAATVDSLEYSKFNAMIYKTKDKNKTVIWLFEQEDDNNDDLDDSI